MKEVAIIGSGPAGLTAAIYLARADLKPVVYTGLQLGGQLMQTTVIENFPGFIDGIDGPELMMNMYQQAEKLGAVMIQKNVASVENTSDGKKIITDDGETETYKSIIIATGSLPNKLGVTGENEYWGKGVSSCATCDGAFYRGKVVAVIGGGDSAMEEANFLTKFANKVYVIHRGSEFKASKIMQTRTFNNPKIEVLWNKQIKEIHGEKVVNGVTAVSTIDGKEENLVLDGVFLAIGHKPATGIFKDLVKLDIAGYVEVTNNTRTSMEGVFVAGDVRDHVYKQAISAAGMGCMAALDCEKWLADKE